MTYRLNLVIICGLCILCGCSTSPEPEYYTLSAIAGKSHSDKALNVKLRRPTIPETLNKPEMVSLSGKFRVTENDRHLWSEPLDTMIERIVAEDLRTRLPHSIIITDASRTAIKSPFTLDVDIQQLGTDTQGNAIFQAQAIIHHGDDKVIAVPVTLHGAKVTSPESLADRLSIILGDFSDNIAENLNIHPH